MSCSQCADLVQQVLANHLSPSMAFGGHKDSPDNAMSQPVRLAAITMESVGVPVEQALAASGEGQMVGQVWEYLPRCPICHHWVSPRTGVCNYAKCGSSGQQVVEATGWPPAGVKIVRYKAMVDQIRQQYGLPAPKPPTPKNLTGQEVDQEAIAAVLEAETIVDAAYDLQTMTGESGEAEEIPGLNMNDHVILPEHTQAILDGGPKTKFKNNVAAIRLLRQLEEEDRDATPEEKEVLARYVGWGGLSAAFDSSNSADYWGGDKREWTDEYEELKALLTPEEWNSCMASTPNGHYTPPEVIQSVWEAVQRMGFEGGMVLEPAAGAGHFLGLCPQEITSNSRRTAVELDDISGRLVKKLYPDSNVQIGAFQDTKLPDDFFDLAIGNVPFGDYGVSDPAFNKGRRHLTTSIHNYFFAKSLDKVRPGGLVAFVTSRYTLDSANAEVREYLASRADFVGAIRLPETAFKKMANTETTTDIIFLRKRSDDEDPGDMSWTETAAVDLGDGGHSSWRDKQRINRHFVDHPEMVLGTLVQKGDWRGPHLAVVDDGRDLGVALTEVIQALPENIMSTQVRCQNCGGFLTKDGVCNNPNCNGEKPQGIPSYQRPVIGLGDDNRIGHYRVGDDGEVYQYIDSESGYSRIEFGKKDQPRATGLIQIKNAAREVLRHNIEGSEDADLEAAQATMNGVYDQFVAEYGPISSRRNRNILVDDPDLPFMLALEDFDAEANTATKADFFDKRTVRRQMAPETADTAEEALLISLNETGVVNWQRMEGLTGQTERKLQEILAGKHVFKNPEGGEWEAADAYLSGNLRKKLAAAQAAAAISPRLYTVNVEALESAIPEDLLPSEIHASLGSGWIPAKDVEAFAHDLLTKAGTRFYQAPLNIQHIEDLGTWVVSVRDRRIEYNVANRSTWGAGGKDMVELLTLALNGKTPTVYFPKADTGDKAEVDHSATLAAREMQDKIKERFLAWVWEEPERAERLAKEYNEKFNAFVPRTFSGSHLTLPGSSPEVGLRPHQKDAVWRIVQGEENTLLGHVVGSGKTFTMIAAGMEQRRLGLRNKVMHAIPNHMLEQYAADFQRLYPGANVLLLSAKDLGSAEKRQQSMARIATQDWDAVVVTHSALGKLPVKDETFNAYVEQEIETLERNLTEMRIEAQKAGYYDRAGHQKTIKEIEKAKKRLEKKLLDRRNAENKDQTLTWEELGIDQLFVDEAHNFKNLGFATKRTRVAGLASTESQRAFDLYIKTQYLSRRCSCGAFIGEDGVCKRCLGKTKVEKGGVVFATGTPISNSIAEMYTMMRFLQRDTMKELGLDHFDNWAAQFGDTVTALEMKPSGDGWREFTRFARFNNVGELLRLWSKCADIEVDNAALGLTLPQVSGGRAEGISVPASQELKDFIQECSARAERLRDVDPRQDNMLKIVTEANQAALDMRLIDPALPDDPNSKVNRAVAEILKIHQDTTGVSIPGYDAPQNMAQMVFLDTSTPTGNGFNVYDDMKAKLIASGIPEAEIAFIHDAKTDTAKLELFDKVNAGSVRVLIGSTEKMGSGTNAQRRLAALHHIDAPWRPSDVEQREGRILRQGNINSEVQVKRYVTEGSFDVYKWQVLQSKAKFIAQVMTGDLAERSVEDVDTVTIGYAEMKALATGNPAIIEKIRTEGELRKMRGLEKAFRDKQFGMRGMIRANGAKLGACQSQIALLEEGQNAVQGHPTEFAVTLNGKVSTDREEVGEWLGKVYDAVRQTKKQGQIGEIWGFPIRVIGHGVDQVPDMFVEITPKLRVPFEPGDSPAGNATRLVNCIDRIPKRIEAVQQQMEELAQRTQQTEAELLVPFEHTQAMAELEAKLADLTALVEGMSKNDPSLEQAIHSLDDSDEA